jgi:DHA1 family multidrug resistance protein-like MFS transporter
LIHAGILAGAFLFNLGQGVLRPTMPLYLQGVFAANYRMVTWVPTVFGLGKWIANVPTGYLQDRLGRRTLMACGLFLIACCDVASILASTFVVFLAVRAVAGLGWAMFGTVATTTMVDQSAAQRRGRSVSALLMSETSGLLLGSAAGGWLYRDIGVTSPLLFEAGCMLVAAVVVAGWARPAVARPSPSHAVRGRRVPGLVLRSPVVLVMGLTSAALITVQAGVLVFLFPLYLVNRAGIDAGTVGVLISLTVLGRLLALWLGGSASDRWGRLPVLMPGLVAFAALLGSVTSITDPALLAIWSLLIGGASGVVASIPAALVGDGVAPPEQGVAIGWLRTMTDSGQIVGPLVMGALADAVGLRAPFLFAAALLVATAAGSRFLRPRAAAVAPAGAGS